MARQDAAEKTLELMPALARPPRRRGLRVAVLLGALAAAGCRRSLPPGPVAPDEPAQGDVPQGAPPLATLHGCRVTPLASYHLVARVLSAERYHFDREASYAPVDLAVGWGRMSDSSILKRVDVSQAYRFFSWHVDQFPIPRAEIESHAANVHCIPADADVRRRLLRAGRDDVVDMDGYLVTLSCDDGWTWTSSLVRTDTGAGSCELFYVTRMDVGDR